MAQEHQIVGHSVLRKDARSKVTGQALYPADLCPEGAAHMVTVFAGRPHARILSMDTAAAEAADGVIAVLTAKDVPVNAYGLQMKDQPVLCGLGSGVPGADVVRCVGDQVALVIAETEAQARAAVALIRIEWEDLPLLLDPEEAAPHLAGGLAAADASAAVPWQLQPHCPDNVIYSYRIRKGDAASAMAGADVVVEGVYQTPWQEHAYLQPEAGVAYLDEEGRVTVAVAGQWTHEDQKEIAGCLGLPIDRVRVIYPAIGGAFGGREDMSVQITLGLAAWHLSGRGTGRGRPVKTVWTREESIIGHGKRHPMKLYARLGARRDGALVAAQVKVIADGGAYCYTSNKVLGNTTLTCTGPYEIPHVAVDTYAVYTNNVPGAAFRGFGGPQGAFAAECQMDRLAEALGMDPVALRLKNVLTGDRLSVTGTPIPGGTGMAEAIIAAAKAAGWSQDERGEWGRTKDEGRKTNLLQQRPAVAEAAGWSQDERGEWGRTKDEGRKTGVPTQRPAVAEAAGGQPAILRGVGFAAGFKNVGFSLGYQDNCWARVELSGKAEIEAATVTCASADCGQGNHTVLAQIAAEIVGVPYERVRVVASDTAGMQSSGSASASRLTFMSGNAVRGAAEQALAAWRREERPAAAEYVYLAPKTTQLDPETGYGMPNFAYGYAAQVAEVSVDTETGQVTVERFVCADDVGKAINPQLVAGQIEGGAVQALGYALLEDFRMDGGRVISDRLSTYLIPTILDVPEEFETLIVEVPDPNGPYGARGMGEMPYLPAAPAVANALHDATGLRFDRFPFTAQAVLKALRSR